MDPLSILISIISGILLPIVFYIANKVYYINHKISYIEGVVKELENDIRWIKKLLEEVRQKVFKH